MTKTPISQIKTYTSPMGIEKTTPTPPLFQNKIGIKNIKYECNLFRFRIIMTFMCLVSLEI